MVHACSFNDLEHEFADSFSNTTGELKAAVATAEEQQHQLMSEISLEKQRHASLPEKRRRRVSLQEDLVKFEDFTKNLEAHKGQQEAKIQERTAGLDSQRQQVEVPCTGSLFSVLFLWASEISLSVTRLPRSASVSP